MEWKKIIKNAMKLRKRIKRVEKEYEKWFSLLSGLNDEDKKEYIANDLQEYLIKKNISFPLDILLNKTRFLKNEEIDYKKQKMKILCNIRAYPLTFIISNLSLEEEKRIKELLFPSSTNLCSFIIYDIFDTHGFCVYFSDKYDEKLDRVGETIHEELHNSFRIYRGEREGTDFMILSEINCISKEIREKFDKNKYLREKAWNYCSSYLLDNMNIDRAYKENLREKINYICNKIMPEWQSRYDERVLTKVFIKAKDLDDLISWYRLPERKRLMDKWQSRYE